MKTRYILWPVTLAVFLCAALGVCAQDGANKPAALGAAAPPVAISAATSPLDLARAAFTAQGGEKFRNLKSMVLTGSVDLYPPNSTQSAPGKFQLVTSGARLRMEVDARPIIYFKQVSDGQNSYSSLPNVQFPPPNRFGLPVLANFDKAGFVVTALPDNKKLRGFKITDPDGNATDFYLDAAGHVLTYLFQYNGYNFGVENSKFKEVEGVLVPFKFTQRLEMPQGAAFAEYSVKDVKLNQGLGDDVFAIPSP
jgi:hypothetical protein